MRVTVVCLKDAGEPSECGERPILSSDDDVAVGADVSVGVSGSLQGIQSG